jgi:hypothetical protein
VNRRTFLTGAFLVPFSIKRIPHRYVIVEITTDAVRKKRGDCIRYTVDRLHDEVVKLYYVANTKRVELPEIVSERFYYNVSSELEKFGIHYENDNCWFGPSIQNRIKGDVLKIKVYSNMRVEITEVYKL